MEQQSSLVNGIANDGKRDNEDMGTSGTVPSAASYVLRHKLLWNGAQLENATTGHVGIVNFVTQTCTEPALKSKDDSWVGEGKGMKCQTNIELGGVVPDVGANDGGIKKKTACRLAFNWQKMCQLEKWKSSCINPKPSTQEIAKMHMHSKQRCAKDFCKNVDSTKQ